MEVVFLASRDHEHRKYVRHEAAFAAPFFSYNKDTRFRDVL